MLKLSSLIFLTICMGLLQPENHPPAVKIMTPRNNSLFGWNTPINYTISVSDKEDGESKYEEINAKEVLLEVKYVKDESKIRAELNKGVQNDPLGLASIRVSNCFNCHNFNAKSIGPSFFEISRRYLPTLSIRALLAKRIREGSSGVWGKVSMPTHPELTEEETQNMVQWILEAAAHPDINYYTGTEGTFRIAPPVAAKRKGAYVLIASYTDHGSKDVSKKHLKGQDIVIIHGR